MATDGGAYWMCGESGQLQREVFPDSEASTERYDNWWRGHELDGAALDRMVAKNRAHLSSLVGDCGGKRLYEVGAGLGYRMLAARDLGFEVRGNELSRFAVERAAERFGLAMDLGLIENVALEADAYDVILLDNVFEHLEQPAAVLGALSASLRAGGSIYVHTINGESLCLKRTTSRWPYFNQAHLYVPTLVSMRAYCEAAGLEIASLRTHGYRSSVAGHRGKGSRWERLGDKVMAAVAGRLGLGHRMDLVLRKPG